MKIWIGEENEKKEYLGEVIDFSMDITREVSPIYRMGHDIPYDFNRGKESITGNFTFIRNELITGKFIEHLQKITNNNIVTKADKDNNLQRIELISL